LSADIAVAISTLKELVLSAGTVTEPVDVADAVADVDVAGVVDDEDDDADDEQAATTMTPADARATQLSRRRRRPASLLFLDLMPYTPFA